MQPVDFFSTLINGCCNHKVVDLQPCGNLEYVVLGSTHNNLLHESIRDHPFKGGGVKNLPNLPTDSSKKLLTVGGRGRKS